MVIAVIGFLYFRKGTTMPGEENFGTNFLSQFNPFGSKKPTPPTVMPPVVDVSGYEPGSGEETLKVKLTKVSSMPIAGFVVFIKERLKEVATTPPPAPFLNEGGEGGGNSKPKPALKPTPPPTEFVPALRYVEKARGIIYQTFADKIEERKFSVTTIPRVYEAYFGNHGDSVVIRYLKGDGKTIETFVGTLPKEYLGADTIGDNEIKGSFLPNNIKDISVSPDTTKIFYLFENVDNIIGTTLSLLDNKKVQVFDSPFTEWLSQWPNDKTIILSTKPSFSIPGYMYSIDLAKKSLTKTLGDINGLTTLTSPDGKLVLYANGNLSLSLYHTDTRNSDLLGVQTLPEKCVWGKVSDVVYCAVPKAIDAGGYPDAWYQGEVSLRDQLWKIDIKNGNATLLVDPITVVGGEEIDGIKLALDEGENYLFFVNKKDSFLWKLELK